MEFLPIFLILVASLAFGGAFHRFHLPWVSGLIVTGMLLGPFGLGLVEPDGTLRFLGELGLVFLMFMAGLETKLSSFRVFGSQILTAAVAHGLLPFAAGCLLGAVAGLDPLASLMVGVLLMSSSVAVIIPALEETGLIARRAGKVAVASIMLVDMACLVTLSVLLQTVRPETTLPLPLFYALVAVVTAALWFLVPRIRGFFPHHKNERDLFESEVRIIFLILLGTVVIFEILGLHHIIAGFLSGLLLSESLKSEVLIEKLRTMSYGLFIPIFFVLVGMDTDLVALWSNETLGFIGLFVLVAIVVKYASGWLGARVAGLTWREAHTVGVSVTPRLATSLVIVLIAVEYAVLPPMYAAAVLVLAMVTTICAPLALRRMPER